jgi:hypothetical protein
VLAAFTQKRKPILFKVSHQITAFDRHLYLDCNLLEESPTERDLPVLLAIGRDHFV